MKVKIGLVLVLALYSFCMFQGGYKLQYERLYPQISQLEKDVRLYESLYDFYLSDRNSWMEVSVNLADQIDYLRENPVIEYVEVPVTVYEEVIKEVPQSFRYFSSVQEAQEWLDDNKPPIVVIGDLYHPDSTCECNYYANQYILEALKDGYIISEASVYNGRVYGIKVTNNSPGYHVGLLLRIDNHYYYYESTPFDPTGSLNNQKLKIISTPDFDLRID
jgi:hypothetical protein